MEFKITSWQTPAEILFNYEELKAELTEKMKLYEGLVYTEDQTKEAKAERANLNKLRTAIDNERKRIKKEYMKSFEAYEAKCKDLIGLIDRPIALIDKQLKEYENVKKAEKKAEIEALYAEMQFPDFCPLERIWDNRWLNAGTTLASVKKTLQWYLDGIASAFKTINALPEYRFEATEVFKETMSLEKAIQEASRLVDLQKRKAEQLAKEEQEAEFAKMLTEQQKALTETQEVSPEPVTVTPTEESEAEWVAFSALLTPEQAAGLAQYLKGNGIVFRKATLDTERVAGQLYTTFFGDLTKEDSLALAEELQNFVI